MTTHDKMLARLRAVLPLQMLPPGTVLRRTHAGRIQRSQGAWSWSAISADGAELRVGSQYPITSLLAHEWLLITRDAGGDYQVDPLTAPLHARSGPVFAIA